MSSTSLRIVAFGDPEGSAWGAVLEAGGQLLAAAGRGADATPRDVRLQPRDGEWVLEGDEVGLRVAPAEPPAEASQAETAGPATGRSGAPAAEAAAEAGEQDTDAPSDELCRARGRLSLGGRAVDLDCPAIRIDLDEVDLDGLDSARAVYGWFEGDQALALLSLRPRRSADHESDRLTATLFGPDGITVVTEPRLSTTYAADGAPIRANLELWIRKGEEEYPRRAAVEAVGPPVRIRAGELALEAVPMRCHGRGVDGTGVYLLLRR